jgi:hypothetical protein
MRRAILLTAILLAVTAIKIDTAYVNDPIDSSSKSVPINMLLVKRTPNVFLLFRNAKRSVEAVNHVGNSVFQERAAKPPSIPPNVPPPMDAMEPLLSQ